MTTRAETRVLTEASQQTVAALREIGADYVADRIERCAYARRHRVAGQRHWTCRGAGCPWCVRSLIARWRRVLFDTVDDDPSVSTVVIHICAVDSDLRDIVRTYRRALRDLRDRAGRRHRLWRTVGAAGMLLPTATERLMVLRVQHNGRTRDQVARLFQHRWAEATILPGSETPQLSTIKLSLSDRVALAVIRRGVEPLRVVLAPQRQLASRPRYPRCAFVPPMPILI